MADQEKQLDQLLDSLLTNYADAEPRPGFETRLLASLREPRRAFRFGWLWAAATAMVATVAVFAIYYSRIAELPQPPSIQAVKPPVLPTIRPIPIPEVGGHLAKRTVEPAPLVSAVDVRQEVFPTPVPLSEQEALMLRYLAGTPRSEVAVHAHEDEPPEKTDPLRPESQRLNRTESFSTQ